MYNIWFNVASLVISLVIGYAIIIRKSPRTEQNERFYIAYLAVVIATASDLMQTSITNYLPDAYKGKLIKILFLFLSSVYLSAHIYSAVAFIRYIRAIFNLHITKLVQGLRIYLPFVICVALVAINLYEPVLFEIEADLVSHRRSMMVIFYLSGAYYLVYTVILIIRFMKGISPDKLFSLLSFTVLAVSANIIQLLDQSMRVENFFNMLEVFLMYIAIESPLDYIDSQSGLQNDKAFYFKINVSQQRREKRHFLLLMIDNENALDRSLATGVLDSLLVEAGFFLRRLSSKITTYRISRANFILDVTKISSDETRKYIRRIQDRFSRPFHTDSYALVLSACCCSINTPENAETREEMNHLIELATNSHHIKNNFYITCEDLDLEGDNKRQRISTLLRTALIDNTISIRYQPIFSVKDNAYTALELKSFISSSTYGLVSGKEFVTLAEQNGTIADISKNILKRACEFITREGLIAKGIKEVQVLMPVSELMKSQISSSVTDLVDSYHLPRQIFCFEILEETFINYGGIITQSMNEMRARGFHFLLDNYGIGYTNMNTLIKMPLTSVALDKSIIFSSIKSKKSETILSANTNLLKRLNLNVKAKHIEKKEQMEYAKEMGFNMLQGYYFSVPLDEKETIDFLRRQA